MWVAKTDLADTFAPTVFEKLVPSEHLRQHGRFWIAELSFEADMIENEGSYTAFASLEADPAAGLSKGDWFTREAPVFDQGGEGVLQLTLSKL